MRHPIFEQDWASRTVLLLQGPVGPFFWRAAKWLKARGARVIKINFNGGDCLFYPIGRPYLGAPEKLAAHLQRLIEREGISDVWLFGDCRPIHRQAIEAARLLGARVWVFEEGYFRPAFITCELGGVNGNSALPRHAGAYADWGPWTGDAHIRQPHRRTFAVMAAWAILYWVFAYLAYPIFWRYRHHRSLNAPAEALRWARGYVRKFIYARRERGVLEQLIERHAGKFVLVALQVHNDAQVMHHSPYADVKDFIREVLESFAHHAPADLVLVFKHHPMDRAYREYGPQIRFMAQDLGVSDRVFVIHDQHLPTLLAHAAGVVAINSTVGLSAVHQGVATHVCGTAFYDFAGLTHQGCLHEFWSDPAAHRPDPQIYARFRHAVIAQTQINDNFYRPITDWEGAQTAFSSVVADMQPIARNCAG